MLITYTIFSSLHAMTMSPSTCSQALSSLAQPDSYTSGGGGRESGKVLYIELSQRLV